MLTVKKSLLFSLNMRESSWKHAETQEVHGCENHSILDLTSLSTGKIIYSKYTVSYINLFSMVVFGSH